ncbi:uncharacterized protein [Hetaerina americana]|uniref:uncharacterized protein n=1 Tax=Hetaerina americana TaxID=62018 RepID=UPI003A7F10A0
MSEAEAAIIKPDGSPYVTVFVSDSEVIADENDDAQVVDTRQIIVHADESVAVEDYNDIHCVIAQENGKFEPVDTDELSNDSSRTLWTRNNVKLLINEYKSLLPEFQDPRRKQKDLWATLAARLSEKVAKEEGESGAWMTSQVTWDACDRKWRNLKHTFKTIHTNQWRSFRSRSRWEFYTPLLEIFGNSIDSQRPMKKEKTRYVVVHPPSSQEGGRPILLPTTRKPPSSARQTNASTHEMIIPAEDGGSGEETVFMEEVKMGESGAPGLVVMKSSKIISSEPLKKQMKLSHLVQGEVKITEPQDGEPLVSIDKDNESSSRLSSSKTKEDEVASKEISDRTNATAAQEAGERSSAPPVWFINFLKEYQEEEKKRRESLKKAHEELLRVEERKVKVLESILHRMSSGQLSNSNKSNDKSIKSEKHS